MEISSSEIQKRQNIQVRCQQMFSSLIPSALCPENASSFYTPQITESPKGGIKVIFDQGVDPDPLFSGPVRAHIYLDKNKDFVCETTPLEKKQQHLLRKEILWPKTNSVSLEFFAFSDKKYQWLKSWPKSQSDIPPMVKITITDEKSSTKEFAFFLPSSHAAIIYDSLRPSS